MIQDFVMAWDANKEKLKAYFMADNPEGCASYMGLVKVLFEVVVNPYLKDNKKGVYDTERIHEINDGDYQGSLLYVIPVQTYQPSCYHYVLTYAEYGSCAMCDELEGIWDYERITGNREETAESLMSLCLHLLQHCKIPYPC